MWAPDFKEIDRWFVIGVGMYEVGLWRFIVPSISLYVAIQSYFWHKYSYQWSATFNFV